MTYKFKALRHFYRTTAFLSAIIILFQSCDSTRTTSKEASKNQTVTSYPYKFVDVKRETRKSDGSYNEMTLYVCGNYPNIDTLRMFCKAKKDSIADGYFHVITFFINKDYAKFTEYPITSMYGIDEAPAKYIKADYTYNFNNGYSKLTVYEKNSWESKSIQYDIN